MKITEIINSSGELIGADNIPTAGSDLDTVAKGTTDTNLRTGHQPYRYDMMARFGFLGMPFYENKGDDKLVVFDEIDNIIYDKIYEYMQKFYKNPSLLKTEFREMSNKKLDDCSEKIKKSIRSTTDNIFEKIGENLKNSVQNNNIDESKIIEDIVVNKIVELELAEKGKGNDIQTKDVSKIAGLINKKLSKKNINKLINLLEIK